MYSAATAMYRAATAICRYAGSTTGSVHILGPHLSTVVGALLPLHSDSIAALPRRRPLVLSRTAARARSAQGASQFAAGYAAVRFPHHGDDSPVRIMKTS